MYLISKSAGEALDALIEGSSMLLYWEDSGLFYTSNEYLQEMKEYLNLDADLEALAAVTQVINPKAFRIYEFIETDETTDWFKLPASIIVPKVLVLDLYKESIVEWGERVSEVWYASYDRELGYSDPVVKFEYAYTRDSDNLYVQERAMTISWTLFDGSWSDQTKVSHKHYRDLKDQIAELKRRRENLITDITVRAILFGIGDAVGQLFKDYMNMINRWRDAGDPAFRDALITAPVESYPWLAAPLPDGSGNTIRDLLVATFSISVV